jgi:hypothetical protein
MSDANATLSDHRRTRLRGNDWGTGLSPAIERARASREPKKPPAPVEATKPAPEVPTLATLPHGALYRIVLDLEALQDGFLDRIDDLGIAFTEVDSAGKLTRGNAQKLLSKSDAKWCREFGWKSLGKMLKGTGLALALIVDDERFAPIRAQMSQRKWKRRPPKLLPPPRVP